MVSYDEYFSSRDPAMTVHGKCKAWLRASLRPATMAGVILIAACWFVVAFVLTVERDKTIEGALKQSDGLVDRKSVV